MNYRATHRTALSFIIAKHTHPSVQHLYWDSNPQEGLDKSYSAADTYTGQVLNIKSSYVTREEAERDCERMRVSCKTTNVRLAENPSGWYAVCPVAY